MNIVLVLAAAIFMLSGMFTLAGLMPAVASEEITANGLIGLWTGSLLLGVVVARYLHRRLLGDGTSLARIVITITWLSTLWGGGINVAKAVNGVLLGEPVHRAVLRIALAALLVGLALGVRRRRRIAADLLAGLALAIVLLGWFPLYWLAVFGLYEWCAYLLGKQERAQQLMKSR